MIGKTILHYNILEKLGAGGMGVVYKAEDTKLKRDVAIKFLPRQIAASEEERERFKIEAQAAAALNHPNIAQVYAIEETDDETCEEPGTLFIVMEYIEGRELKSIIDTPLVPPRGGTKGGALPSRGVSNDDAFDYATQIAEGLQAAHENGVVHRDIKPANIMISKSGVAKITDFGLAKLVHGKMVTRAGFTLGTVAYMSPEQSRGDPIDPRTDIWSLGVVIYQMLTGEMPFKGHYEQAVIYSLLHEEPAPLPETNPEVTENVAAIVNKALQKNPAERYQKIGELLADLKTAAVKSETPASKEKTHHAIAVLPFKDLSPGKDQDYFCDGITEELIDSLCKIGGWRVVSRTSVFAFKGKEKNIREIGEQLNVNHILEGSVRKAGNRLRITSQLINVQDGFQLWSEKYDRKFDDVFAIQDDIASMITDKLQAGVGEKREESVVQRHSQNLEAYNLYLQARFHLNKRTEEGLRKGLAFCEQAIALDSYYALAYAGLADGFILLGFQGFMRPHEALPKAKAAAEKALALDGALAEAHTSLGPILAVYDYNWPESEKAFQQAQALNQNSATAHYWYAIWNLLPTARFERCLAELKKAQELDPLSLVLNAGIGWQYYFARKNDLAIEALQKTLELDDKFIFAHDILGQVYEQKGMLEEAIVEIEKAVALSKRRTLSLSALGYTFATAGMMQEAKRVLEELKTRAKNEYVSAYDAALVHAGMGKTQHAFALLEKAYEDRTGWLCFLNVEPRFDSLRKDPRFKTLLKKVGLSPYSISKF
ncbi:MAG: protein kinase [bacterium]